MDQWNDNGDGGGFFTGNDTGTPTQSVASNARQQFLCPVTVRQVLEAPEQGLKVGPLTATMVSLCGIVSGIDATSTTIKFCLSDDTGVVDCLEWLETQDDNKVQNASNLVENKYYRVFGCIKFPQGSRRIMVFNTARVRDFNEVTTFMIEVLSANEYAEKSEKDQKQTAINAFDPNSYNSYNSYNHGVQEDKDKLTPIQKAVLEAISAVQNHVGWSRFDSKLTKKYSEKDIQDVLEKLVCEGHIYTTIDDDHYCCT